MSPYDLVRFPYQINVIAAALLLVCSACVGETVTTQAASTSGQIEADASGGSNADRGDVQSTADSGGVQREDSGGTTPDTDNVSEDTGVVVQDTGGPQDTGGLPDTDSVEEDTSTGEPDLPPGLSDPPPIPSYSAGTCPVLNFGPNSGSAVNQGFPTAGDTPRDFRLIVPDNYDGSRPWPVVFAWHWLNASSNSFVSQGELESATEAMEFIAVLPDRLERDGDKAYLFDWPFVETWGAEDELVFFDDLLACVNDQFNIDDRRVYGIGVSAGALWLTYLSSTDRINHFAAVESLSGGLGEVAGVWGLEFAPQPHKFPAIVLWGGQNDWLGLSFSEASVRYQNALRSDGHFVVSCVHDSGHMVPPIEPPTPGDTRFRSLWQFMLDHPYGLAPGQSPYLETGLPSVFPEWCSIAP